MGHQIVYDDAQARAAVNTEIPDNNSQLVKPVNVRRVSNKMLDAFTAGLLSAQTAIDEIFETFSLADRLGTFNAATGAYVIDETGVTGTLVATPAFPKGKYFDCITPGTNSLTGVSKEFVKADKIISAATKWAWVPARDTGYEKVTELESRLPSKNLANPSEFVTGKFVNDSGVEASNAAYGHTGFIPVQAGLKYCARGNTKESRYITFYDASKVFVSGLAAVVEFIPPSGVAYVIATYYIADEDNFQVEQSESPTPYTEYKETLQTKGIKVPGEDIKQSKGFQLTSELEKYYLNNPITTAITTEFEGLGANGAAVDIIAGTMSVPNGSTGNTSYILKRIVLAQTKFKVGDTLRFAILVNESTAGMTSSAAIGAGITVTRMGSTSSAPVNNLNVIRVDSTHVLEIFEYTIIDGDTIVYPKYSRKNVTNGSGSAQVWTIELMSYAWINATTKQRYSSYILGETSNKITALENDVAPLKKKLNFLKEVTGAFGGVSLSGGVADTDAGTITVPNGSIGTNTALYKTIILSLHPELKVGNTILFRLTIEEGTAGTATDWNSVSAGLLVLRSGSTIGVTGLSVTKIRLSEKIVQYTYAYEIQSGDTVLYPRLIKSNVSNSTGTSQSWTYLSCYFSSDAVIDMITIASERENRTYLNETWTDLEGKGLLQKRTEQNCPIEGKISNFVSKYRLKRQDVTVVILDGSISTDMNYATKREDQAYRPPCCTENNIPSFIEEKLRWKGQQYRRYDSKTSMGGETNTFTEVGTGTTVNMDAAWDWQFPVLATSGYNGLTRILTGANPAVSYLFSSQNRRCDFIFRTDYLSSASLVVAVSGGNGKVQVYDEGSTTWIEANGYVFSAQESNTLIPAVFGTANNLRKTIFQKRLKMRKVESDIANDRTISISSQDGGRLCYWGITYSPKEFMFQFINSARGSHNISQHENFETWAVDYWKPDLFLFSCNTINESASLAGGSPASFVTRFENYINKIIAKSYTPDVFAYILFTSKGSGAIDANDVVGSNYTASGSYGAYTVFDFLDSLHAKLKSMNIASVNAFYEYWNIGKARSKFYGTKMYDEMFSSSGQSGKSFVSDGTHLNDYGAMIGWRFLEKYFNF